jgi:hypothetical protein
MFLKSLKPLFFFVPFLFLVIYVQVFFADYAYLDDIHMLWHNNDNSNFVMFHSQGRMFSGFLYQKIFSSISSIAQLKWIRIFSLIGWILVTLVWMRLYKNWCLALNFSQELWWLGSLFMVCSLSVCICVGWASCMQVIPATFFALISCNIVFKKLIVQKDTFRLSNVVIGSCLICGVASLFFYQSAFGIFLLPFFLYYFKNKKAKPDRLMIIGVSFYLVTYIIYYFLFNYYLRDYHIEASNRTEIHFNILKKISFFFSGPLPQGFSLNLLFSASSVFSQIFYPLVIIVWLIITFKRNGSNTILENVLFIGGLMVLLALIYLPSMIAAESFPPYRTLLAFNLTVFLMVIDGLFYLLKIKKQKKVLAAIVSLWLIATGAYAFNFQYIGPLKKEYVALKDFFQTHYNPAIKKVYFIRADKFLFTSLYHTRIYRDEFGAPSTYRDWVPEPIIKQMVFEITDDRKKAEEISVMQFEDNNSFAKAKLIFTNSDLIVNMNKILGDRKAGND